MTIDYELAKQLKEAGFPQHGRDAMTPHTADIEAGRESVYYPTLSELIEACGEQFGALSRDTTRTPGQKPYYACARIEKETGAWLGPYGHGSTPDEAVAKLYLALLAHTK